MRPATTVPPTACDQWSVVKQGCEKRGSSTQFVKIASQKTIPTDRQKLRWEIITLCVCQISANCQFLCIFVIKMGIINYIYDMIPPNYFKEISTKSEIDFKSEISTTKSLIQLPQFVLSLMQFNRHNCEFKKIFFNSSEMKHSLQGIV